MKCVHGVCMRERCFVCAAESEAPQAPAPEPLIRRLTAEALRHGRPDRLPFRLPGTSKTEQVECRVYSLIELTRMLEAMVALAQSQRTPAARWRENGEPDPFEGQGYDRERARLCMGHLTDDELANEVFLYDHRSGLKSLAYLTAAKERIRWLSRALVKMAEQPARAWMDPATGLASAHPGGPYTVELVPRQTYHSMMDHRRGEFCRHVKTGGVYEVICNAQDEHDRDRTMVVYRNVETGERWVRPASEFNDGRFVPIA